LDVAQGNHRQHRILRGALAASVLRFGFPLAIAMCLHATFNLVDMFIIGKLPGATIALSALAVGDLLAMVATIVANGVANASVAIIARRDGEHDVAGVRLMTAQSLTATILVSAVFGVVGIVFADGLCGDMMGVKGEARPLAIAYTEIIVGGAYSILLMLQLVAILRAVGDARLPMVLLVGSNLLNLFLAVVLVFGPGEAPAIFGWGPPVARFFGLGAYGVVGAAVSTVICRSAAILIGAVLLWKQHPQLHFKLRDLIPVPDELGRLTRIAWPSSAQFMLRALVVIFFGAIVGHSFTSAQDTSTLTAFGICIRLEGLALFTGMGWGAAASTFVGQNLGANQPARANHAVWMASGFNVMFLLVLQVGMLAFAREIVGLFDATPEVVEAGAEYLYIVGGTYLFLGIAVVLSQALAGAGATLSSLFIDVAILVGLVIPVTVVMLAAGVLTRVQTWTLIAGANVVSAGAYSVWFGMKKWVDKRV
jgi:putative MATE family efflux protein